VRKPNEISEHSGVIRGKHYHAPESWVVNANTTSWAVIAEDLHP